MVIYQGDGWCLFFWFYPHQKNMFSQGKTHPEVDWMEDISLKNAHPAEGVESAQLILEKIDGSFCWLCYPAIGRFIFSHL